MTAGLLAFGGLGSQAVCRTRQERSPQLSHMSERTSQRRLSGRALFIPGLMILDLTSTQVERLRMRMRL